MQPDDSLETVMMDRLPIDWYERLERLRKEQNPKKYGGEDERPKAVIYIDVPQRPEIEKKDYNTGIAIIPDYNIE